MTKIEKILVWIIILIGMMILIMGCSIAPLKGGTSKQVIGSITNELSQPENPASATTQKIKTEQYVYPVMPGEKYAIATNVIWQGNKPGALLQTPPMVQIIKTESETVIGPAQKDVAREIAARAKSMSPLIWAGIACIVGGGALFYFGWPMPAVIAVAVGGGLIAFASVLSTSNGGIILLLGAIGCMGLMYAYYKGHSEKKETITQ
jgi:hypothetical protein